VRTELSFERNTANVYGFSNVRNITFAQNSSIHMNGRSTVSLVKKNKQNWNQEVLAPCFPGRIELTFERNTAYLSGFASGRNIFVQISFLQVKGKSTVSLVRKPSMLEAEGSSTLFPCEN
jgi:hypothetical protein